MKTLTLFISILFLAAGCKDNPADSDTFEPYTIGTWLVESPEQAKWIGDQSMQKTAGLNSTQGDTVEIRTPQNQLIQIIHSDGSNITNKSPDRGYFYFVIRDSSITAADSVSLRVTDFQFPGRGQVDVSGWDMTYFDDHIFARLHSNVPCNTQLSGPVVTINYLREDRTHVATHRLIVNGFSDVLQEIAC